jgi:hypothetical protein
VKRALAALIAAMVAASAGHTAWAFTRDKTDEGTPIYWTTSCVTATVYLNGFTMMTPDAVAKSIGAAAHAWSPSMVTCAGTTAVTHPYFEVVPGMAPAGAAPPPVANDARNIVVFRTQSWDDAFHPDAAVALTSVTKKHDGRILDADIEINAATQAWGNLDPGSPDFTPGNGLNVPFDLQNAITHEFGHFIGLAHTCQGLADPAQLIDNNGNPVPECDFAPASIKATTMFAMIDQASAETSKRVLSQDDVDGVCAIYPAAQDPHACMLDLPDDGCGCATGRAPGADRGGLAVVVVALALALVRTGRGRRAGRARTARPG